MLFSITAQDTPEKHQRPGYLGAREGLSEPHAKIPLAESKTTIDTNLLMSNEQAATEVDVVKAGTTTFVTDSIVQMQEFNQNQYKSMIMPIEDQTIPDFLNKPYAISQGTWSSSQVANTVLFTGSISSMLNSVSSWTNKIQGFNLIRGTACVRLVINANPFQQGKLITTFLPDGQNLTFRGLDLAQKTQQPNVEIDCRDASSLIKIPYIAPTDWYDRKSGFANWGDVFISVLAPLSTGSGGENSINYTVFLYFENFELAAPIVPQSGVSSQKRTPRPNNTFVAQADKESSAMQSSGSVSKGLAIGAQVATAVSTIPMLAPLAEPASWILRGASKIAAWFGWSKPQIDSVPCVSSRRLISNMSNATGASTAPTLALYHDNAVEVMSDMAGNGVDEMAFDYLKTRKSLIRSTGWSTSNVPGDILYSVDIVPYQMTALQSSYISNTHTYGLTSMPPFAYLAQNFTLWRGSIDILIKFAKTDFHSGRLLITFTPVRGISVNPTIQTSILALREIVDIRGKSEILLKLPYLANLGYLRQDQSLGWLQVQVLNELRCPETCSQGVNMLVYASAGDDFELEVPGRFVSQIQPPFVPQGGAGEADLDQAVVAEPIGGYTVPAMSLEPARTCVGEVFTSVKQLIARYTPLQTNVDVISNDYGSYGMYPFYMGLPTNSVADGTRVVPPYSCDALSIYAAGYAFFRGGVRIVDVCNDYQQSAPRSFLMTDSQNGGTVFDFSTALTTTYDNRINPFTEKNATNSGAFQIHDTSVGSLEVRVPYYCQAHMSVVRPTVQVIPEGTTDPNAMLYNGVADYNAGTYEPSRHKLYRSASDEFQLSYFLGFPPIVTSYV